MAVSPSAEDRFAPRAALPRIDQLIRSDAGGVLTIVAGADRVVAAAHALRRAQAAGRRAVLVDGARVEEPWRELGLALGLRQAVDALTMARRIRQAAADAVLVVCERARTAWGGAVLDELCRSLAQSSDGADRVATVLIVFSDRRARFGATATLPETCAPQDVIAYLDGLMAEARCRPGAFAQLRDVDAWWHGRDPSEAPTPLEPPAPLERPAPLDADGATLAPPPAAEGGDAWSKLRNAELCAAAGEHDRALALGRAAIESAPDGLSRADLWRRLDAAVRHFIREGEAAELAAVALARGDVEQAHRLVATTSGDSFDGALLEGQVALARGDLERARGAFAHAAERAGGPRQRCESALGLAELALAQGQHDAARALAAAALEQASADDLRLAARNALGKVMLAAGAWSAAEEHYGADERAAAAAGRGADALRARLNRAIAVISTGRRVEGHALLESLLVEGEREGHAGAVAFALANLGWLATVARQYAAAIAYFERAIAAARVAGETTQLARQLLNLADVHVRVGLLGEAEQGLLAARQACGASLGPDLALQLALVTAELLLASGAAAAASVAAEEAITHAEASNNGANRGHAHRIASLAALEQGDVDRAAQLLERARQAAAGPHSAAFDAWLGAAVARRGGGPWAEAAARALGLALAAGDGEMTWRARELCAHAALDAGDRHAAIEHLELALAQRDALAQGLPEPLLRAFLGRRDLGRLERLEARVRGAATAERGAGDAAPRPPARRRLVGETPAMRALRRAVAKVGPSQATVLIAGESGSGKDLVAEALHAASDRAAGPLVKVNCAALVETLLMSELFGHERGAFTGAHCKRRGRLELANHGTLFLDEIGDISPSTQLSLLRVLQERSFERVGGTTPIEVDVRIVCATHRDVRALVAAGAFREDLYYRLSCVTMHVPALRDRLDDVPLIASDVLEQVARERGEPVKRLSDDAQEVLRGHRWPGNVRELRNALRAAALFTEEGLIRASDLTAHVEALRGLTARAPAVAVATEPPSSRVRATPSPLDAAYAEVRDGSISLPELKKLLERACIERALDDSDGNVTHAAKLLGMKRPRLSQLVNQYAREAREEAS